MANPEALEIIRASVKKWNNWRFRLGTSGSPRSLRDLTNVDLANARLSDVNLSNCDLTGATLKGALLRRADLRGAILENVNLQRGNLTGADLTGADLTGADLTGADLTDIDLTDAFGLNSANFGTTIGFDTSRWLGIAPDDTAVVASPTNKTTIGLETERTTNAADDFSREISDDEETEDDKVENRIGKVGRTANAGTVHTTLQAPSAESGFPTPDLSPYQSVLVTTPLDFPAIKNPTLAAFAINLGSKENEFVAHWSKKHVQDALETKVIQAESAADFIQRISRLNDPAFVQGITDAIDTETAIGYFGSIKGLSLRVLDGIGADKLIAVGQISEQVSDLGIIQIGGTVIGVAIIWGTAEGIKKALVEEIPRIVRMIVDHTLKEIAESAPPVSPKRKKKKKT